MKVYLDFNSTHPPDRAALDLARNFYLEHFANTSGLSAASQVTNRAVEKAREQIAAMLHIRPAQIVFTSCATESNNLLISYFAGMAGNRSLRILSSPLEHPSVAETLKALPAAEIDYLKFTRELHISRGPEKMAVYDLVCAVAVQSESGVRLPVAEIVNSPAHRAENILCDYTQALGRLTPETANEVARLTADNIFLTASGHKIGAGYGAGLIILPQAFSETAKPLHLMQGGNQEFQHRAGSHNVEAILALASALEHRIQENNLMRWQAVQQQLESALMLKLAFISGLEIIGSKVERAPGTTLLLLPGIAIDFLVMALDNAGITVSTGTSCKSRSRTPSQSLMQCGYSETEALSVIRLSYDQFLSGDAITYITEKFAEILSRMGAKPPSY